MKKTKGNLERGITLVALIITIIVMLILVAVTVTVLVDSDIIGKSEEAGALYQGAYASEGAKVSNETIQGDVSHDNVEGYLQDICKHNDFVDGVCSSCGINKQDICDHNFVDGICTKCGKEDTINFLIEGEEFTAFRGMTFGEWVASDFNPGYFGFDEYGSYSGVFARIWDFECAYISENRRLGRTNLRRYTHQRIKQLSIFH